MGTISINDATVTDYLKANYLAKSNPQMAVELGTTVGSVTGLLQRLQLRRPSRSVEVTDLPNEIWKPCSRHPGFRVSNFGRVANGTVLLVQTVNGRGYSQVKMYLASGERKSERTHRLVADEFIPNPEGKPEVNHIDGDKQNNAVTNLEWVHGWENVRHAVTNGMVRRRSGASHHNCTRSEETIREICRQIAAGIPLATIERNLDLPRNSVSAIRRKRTWKAISDEYFTLDQRSTTIPKGSSVQA
jgi:hypothetical protein